MSSSSDCYMYPRNNTEAREISDRQVYGSSLNYVETVVLASIGGVSEMYLRDQASWMTRLGQCRLGKLGLDRESWTTLSAASACAAAQAQDCDGQ